VTLQAMSTRYLLTYEPRGVSPGGRHRLKVTVKGRKVDVRHRREYLVTEALARRRVTAP
jgi:hypothetical protein